MPYPVETVAAPDGLMVLFLLDIQKGIHVVPTYSNRPNAHLNAHWTTNGNKFVQLTCCPGIQKYRKDYTRQICVGNGLGLRPE